MKRLTDILVVAAVAGIGIGCGDDDGVAPIDSGGADSRVDVDAGGLDSGPIDSPADDAGGGDASMMCSVATPGASIGSACASGDTCSDAAWSCQRSDLAASLPSLHLDGTVGPALSGTIFPEGGECTLTCRLDDGGSTCSECAACEEIYLGRVAVAFDVDPSGNPLGICRPRCTPEVAGRSGCRTGRTCSLEINACVEACQNDMQCKFALRDIDGDDVLENVYLVHRRRDAIKHPTV